MNENAAPSDETSAQVRSNMASLVDLFDAAPKVWMVEVAFNPLVADTYPAHSAAFAAVSGGAGTWQEFDDAESGKRFLVAREPAGGWDFVATAAGVTIVGYVVELATDTTVKICGNLFDEPIPIATVGQHIVLPYVSLPIDQVFGPVPIPQTES